jgi:hypothetical protein
MQRSRFLTLASSAALLLFVFAGCERGSPPSPPATTQPAATQPTATELASVRSFVQDAASQGSQNLPAGHPLIGDAAAGIMPPVPPAPAPPLDLKYTAPDAWQPQPPSSSLRAAQYRLPRVATDGEDGELAVFSTGIGGTVEDNVSRWRKQFSTPDGQPVPDEAFVQQSFEANGLNITVVDVAGRYSAAMATGAAAEAKGGYRMLAAIVETPRGPRYFKAVGPAATIGAHRDAFIEMLRALKSD